MRNTNGDAAWSDALVLFGVTGDLAHKKIFPAHYAMDKWGVLNVPVVGLATSRLRPAQLRKRVMDAIKESDGIDDQKALDLLRSLLGGVATSMTAWNGVICGVLLIALAVPHGKIKGSYAGWNRYVV